MAVTQYMWEALLIITDSTLFETLIEFQTKQFAVVTRMTPVFN